MPIKTFRGLLANGEQQRVALHHNSGKTGYRILKFQIMNNIPGTLDHENIVKIYKVQQMTVDGVVDFSENTLIGAAFRSGDATANNYPEDITVIFDGEIFNQDIYLTNIDVSGNVALMNYYIELEEMSLALDEATVATLKDIRNSGTPTPTG